jgi:hypothetical protein
MACFTRVKASRRTRTARVARRGFWSFRATVDKSFEAWARRSECIELSICTSDGLKVFVKRSCLSCFSTKRPHNYQTLCEQQTVVFSVKNAFLKFGNVEYESTKYKKRKSGILKPNKAEYKTAKFTKPLIDLHLV